MDEFVRQQNLARYLSCLEGEADPRLRATLQTLLVDEEDRFASRQERIENTSRFILDLGARIKRQQALVARLAELRGEVALGQERLDNMWSTFELLVAYRERVRAAVERDSP